LTDYVVVCGEVMKVLDVLAGLCWKWWAGIVGVVVMFVGVGGGGLSTKSSVVCNLAASRVLTRDALQSGVRLLEASGEICDVSEYQPAKYLCTYSH
jgi:hypothetical protein